MHYTRKGDGGDTSTKNGGGRVPKDSPTTTVLGNIDELDSVMGLCRARARAEGLQDIHDMLLEVQHLLFIAQAQVAGAEKNIKAEHVKRLETLIEQVEGEVRLPQSFVVPGGNELSALCDVARTVARRAERSLVSLCIIEKPRCCEGDLPAFMNRLSSFMYVMARLAAHRAGVREEAPHYGTIH